ncbi:MAG: RnfABCDGE type electron transport complex subunit D [Candidatus Izemoplasmatales bacterium]|jgi:electron transport complex protein RnfD|nr:RnfABCDGE type electron transport complex subunit D [Candidatus Izemoplasmatales bacterium]MDD4355492.1 RnfABCDGE type electron transport complex subunit D [Candidatus Izemoplasmatales bacterium]MDY0373132.1 RnfABCDGE type electron transport complex subunit D [Candidatus Izemoplasmatales bacterium]NLF48626.1 RnfABCDGE type electron transport complex subunit D [Acholeplasmataceae bacterium]
MARFAGGKAPFLRISDQPNQGTGIIMRDFMIGLAPVILFSWYKNGIQVMIDGNIGFFEMLYPLIFILLGGLMSLIMEGITLYIIHPDSRSLKGVMAKLSTSYPMVPGLLLAMVLPLYTPVWVLIFGCFMGTVVGKMLFGGFGHNIFNPALIGYLTIAVTLTGVINAAGGVFNASEVLVDSYAGATPLTLLSRIKELDYDKLVAPYGTLWNFFLGTIPGALAETGALAILVSYGWLVYRKVIKWFTPLIYVGTVFVLSWFIGIASGEPGIWFPLYSILSGGLMFGAVFMATEPVTTPRNPLGKVVFALFLGVFTVLFRYISTLPEGVATSIVFLNIFTMPIDNWTAVIRARGIKKQTAIKASVFAVLFIALVLYAILKAGSMYTAFIQGPIGIGGWF